MAFVCLSMYLSTRLSSCAKPVSGRLSWALLSPCSPRPRIVCRSLAYTVAIALSSCFFAFVLSVSCNTRCLKDIDQTLLSRLLCGDFRTSSCAYSLKVHSSGKPVTNIRVPKISFVSEMIGQYFLIFQYLIKFELLNGITFSCMVRSLVQIKTLGKEAVTDLQLKLPDRRDLILIFRSTSESRASTACKSSVN